MARNPILTHVITAFSGKLVGTDENGNRYYQKSQKDGRIRRWVVYRDDADASQVPASWHGWLHQTELNEANKPPVRYHWLRQHQPNMTGTTQRYLPQGHLLNRQHRPKATGDYTAWRPRSLNDDST